MQRPSLDLLTVNTLAGTTLSALWVSPPRRSSSPSTVGGTTTALRKSGSDVVSGGDGNDNVDGNQGNDIALLGSGDGQLHVGSG